MRKTLATLLLTATLGLTSCGNKTTDQTSKKRCPQSCYVNTDYEKECNLCGQSFVRIEGSDDFRATYNINYNKGFVCSLSVENKPRNKHMITIDQHCDDKVDTVQFVARGDKTPGSYLEYSRNQLKLGAPIFIPFLDERMKYAHTQVINKEPCLRKLDKLFDSKFDQYNLGKGRP